MKTFAVSLKSGHRSARLPFIKGRNLKIVIASKKPPHAVNGRSATTKAQHHSRVVNIDRGNEQTIGPVNGFGIDSGVFLALENCDQCRTIDDNHRTLRSSMTSRGERGSSSGIAAISDPAANISSAVMRRRRPNTGATPART